MKARILLADNSVFTRKLLRRILTMGGHEIVCEVEQGIYAVEKYKEVKPDIAIMEVVLPAYSGLSALGDIVKFDPGAKVIMCTIMRQQSAMMKAIEFGAKSYITKPFRAEKILEEVELVLTGAADKGEADQSSAVNIQFPEGYD